MCLCLINGISPEEDYPNRKMFKVLFRSPLSVGESVEYGYGYNWGKMFPLKSEYFAFLFPIRAKYAAKELNFRHSEGVALPESAETSRRSSNLFQGKL